MSSTAFGEHLKREREMRGVTLEEISAATRISTRFLEALEKEHWDHLPGGVFNRGFIRAVAHFLGLDEDGLLAEYDLVTRHQPEAGISVAPSLKTRRLWLAPVAAGAVIGAIVAGGWIAYRHYGYEVFAHGRKLSATPSPGLMQSAGEASAASSGTVAVPVRSDTAVPIGADVLNAEAGASSPMAANAADRLRLKVEAGKPADVRIIADGKTIFSGLIHAEEKQQFEAKGSLEVRASEASALLLELNGQTVPPLGPPGQAGSITLTRKDLRPRAGGAH